MLKELVSKPRALIYAVLVHVALLGVLVFSFDWTPKTQQQPQIVQAQLVDPSAAQAEQPREQERQREIEAIQRRELERQRMVEERAREQQRRAAELERQRNEEAQRLEQRQRRLQEAEEQRRVLERQRLDAQAQRAAESKKQEVERRQRALDEQRRQAEAEAKSRAEEQAKRQAEERRREQEVVRRREEERLLREQLAAEESQLEADRARADAEWAKRLASLRDQYARAIGDKVERNWIRPSDSRSGLNCTVNVTQAAGGHVINVEVTKCNTTDLATKRSVEVAVRKASPLPAPPDPALFSRELTFLFRPSD